MPEVRELVTARDVMLWFVSALGLSLLALGGACAGNSPSPAQECELDRDCDDGFHCDADHQCVPVISEIGQPCSREGDCGPGQTCSLTTVDTDGDGVADALAPTCQEQSVGLGTGAMCVEDASCATGVCAIGRCVELCAQTTDCPSGTACVGIPRIAVRAAPLFDGCLQAAGTLETAIAVDAVRSLVSIPVPANALSFTIVADVGRTDQAVGTVKLTSPSGELLYQRPAATDEVTFWTQPVRYAPDLQISSMLVPNSSAVKLAAGAYEAEIASFLPGGGVGTLVPDVKVVYRLGTAGHILDVNLYFLDLAGHPCPGADMSAALAANSPLIQDQFLPAWRGAFAQAGLALGDITYHDVTGRPDLDSLQPAELPDLFALSDSDVPALNVFVVRSLDPLGVQALSGGSPGPLDHGTMHSGVVITADALCLASWFNLGRVTAHEAAHYLGLYHNVELDGHVDPLSTTDQGVDNLMYFGAGGGTQLTAEQQDILTRSPILR